MYLSRVIIQHYKSIKKLDLKFEKGKNIIVGRNNAGKSNIIKAIDILLGETSPSYEKIENIVDNDFYCGNTSIPIIIFCELTRDVSENLDYDEIYKCYGFKVHSELDHWENVGGKNRPVKRPIKIQLPESNTDEFLSRLNGVFEVQEDNWSEYINPKLIHQQTFENQFSNKYRFAFALKANKNELGKIEKSIRFLYRENECADWILAFSAPIRNEFLQSAIIPSFRDPQTQLRISNWTWYGKLLKKYVNPDNEKLKEAFKQVKDASNEVFALLQNSINNSRAKVAFPNTEISFQFNPDTRQDVHKSALIYVDDGFKSQLQDKGSGIQSAVIIGLYDFYTREIAHTGSSLLAIEEPELYLHPQGRRVISNRLDDFLDNNKNQVIATTHSPEFVTSAQENLNIIVVKKDKDLGSIANNVSFKTAKEKQILIKNQNAEMFFADYVILVEGGGDKYIIEAIAEEFGQACPELGRNWLNNFNISVIPVVGKTEFWKYSQKLDQVAIKWFIFADFDFLKSALGDFLSNMDYQELKNTHNSVNGKIGQASTDVSKITQLNPALKTEVIQFVNKLKENNVFILSGELEDCYTQKAKDIISSISGKEEKPLHIVSHKLENNASIRDYVDVAEYESYLSIIKGIIQSRTTISN